MIFRLLLVLGAACCALPAAALTIRPDREDAEYLELSSKYPAAIRLRGAGEGVLVAPRWILTSASTVRKLREAKVPALAVGSREFEVLEYFLHEGLGLVALKKDVKDVPFTPLFRGANEEGQTVVLVGHGGDGRKRASINTIDVVSTQALGMRIKPLTEASDLQGMLTPAETGAPIFLQIGGDLTVAGIASGTDGTRETYERVSAFSLWIEATMVEVGRKEAEALLGANRTE
ncbi:MAG: trypsin-like peptidase domain-containing protein [Usitatibacter sp.]